MNSCTIPNHEDYIWDRKKQIIENKTECWDEKELQEPIYRCRSPIFSFLKEVGPVFLWRGSTVNYWLDFIDLGDLWETFKNEGVSIGPALYELLNKSKETEEFLSMLGNEKKRRRTFT